MNADWKELAYINLACNCLGSEGIRQLIRADWKILKRICICRKGIIKNETTPSKCT
jgi:hypothetical protein